MGGIVILELAHVISIIIHEPHSIERTFYLSSAGECIAGDELESLLIISHIHLKDHYD